MALDVVKALLILNAKKSGDEGKPGFIPFVPGGKGKVKSKGWTDAARKKAALTRKAKAKVADAKTSKKVAKTEPKVLLSKVTGKKTLTQRRNEVKAKQKKTTGKIPKQPGTPFETTVKSLVKGDKGQKVKLVEVTGAARLNRSKKRYVMGYGGEIRPFHGAFSLQKGDRVFHDAK